LITKKWFAAFPTIDEGVAPPIHACLLLQLHLACCKRAPVDLSIPLELFDLDPWDALDLFDVFDPPDDFDLFDA
jgi:hypothetical protein